MIDYVDQYHVLYATVPSHGHYSDLPCPDTEEELHEIAWQVAGNKLYWHRGNWRMEGEQRNSIYEYAPDADVIISVDSDEIFSEKLIRKMFEYIDTVQDDAKFHYYRMPFIHYWRSFNKCILHDPAYPVRMIFPKVIGNREITWDAKRDGIVNHFGYATRPEIVAYKWAIHGHKSELRTDVNWFQDVFMNKQRSKDLHPVGSEHWNYEIVEPMLYMPEYMKTHPYFGLDWIE